MKYILLLIFTFNTCYLNSQVQYYFPKMDEIAISLLEGAENEDSKQCELYLAELITTWKDCVNQLEIEDEVFAEIVDSFLANMHVYQKSYQYHYLEILTYDFLIIFKQRREKHCINDYPLDKITNMIDEQTMVSCISKDEMLGKYEWFEFTEFVDRLQEEWNSYIFVPIESIESHFPDINKNYLQQINNELLDCYEELFTAIDTAQRQNFIMPCDNSEKKLRELLYSFGLSKNVNHG